MPFSKIVKEVVKKKDGAWKTPPETKRKRKHSEERKGTKTQNLADEQRIMGRFAKRFSGERPVSLGFEFVFLPSLSELFGGCLTATRSVALVLVKHPPKSHLKFFPCFVEDSQRLKRY